METVGHIAVYAVALLLSLAGLIMSGLSLSGTWLVLSAGGLLWWIQRPDFPGIASLIILLLACIAVEVIEAFAGTWGIQKRGGSKAAGMAALFGGLLGMILGGFIPIPVLGSLIGMLLGSFLLAFWVEQRRMKKIEHAAHVAFGAVLARLAVILIKVGITFLMILYLAIGLAF